MNSILKFIVGTIAVTAGCMMLVTSCNKEDNNDSAKSIALTTKGSEIAKQGQTLTINLLKELQRKESYIVSPLGLQMILSMLAEGASGSTREEIVSVLGIDASEVAEARDYCNKILKGLSKRVRKIQRYIPQMPLLSKRIYRLTISTRASLKARIWQDCTTSPAWMT